jgi:hypothetical protein
MMVMAGLAGVAACAHDASASAPAHKAVRIFRLTLVIIGEGGKLKIKN